MYLIFILIIFLFLNFISNGIILPDGQNPITMLFPNKNTFGNLLTFRFTLPSDSIGLFTGQVIGFKFPNSTLNLPLSSNQFNCSLRDVNGNSYLVSPKYFNILEQIFYCSFDELQKTLFPNGNYILGLNLTAINFFLNTYISQIGLFTSTTNSSDKIIIDSNPAFGDIAFFPDWSNSIYSYFNISAININTTTVNILSTFNFNVTINIVGYTFNTSNNIFLVKFPSDTVIKGEMITIKSYMGSDQSMDLFAKLGGNLTLKPFSYFPQSFLISGIQDTNLINSRKFILNFDNVQVNDNIPPTSPFRYFEIWVMQKNSYSVISYSNILLSNLTFINIPNLSVTHPENVINIYSGGTWPFQFNFSTPTTFTNGGYVVIRQQNTIHNALRLNFISSTCDFTGTQLSAFKISNNYANRPVCFPLRNDFNYNSASYQVQFEGSGFAIKVPYLLANQSFIVTIMGYAESCSTSSTVSISTYSQFAFILRVFRNINMNYFNEDRLFGKSGSPSVMLAQSNIALASHNCYQAYNGNGFVLQDNLAYLSPQSDIFIHKEFYDFRLGIINNNMASTCSNCFFNDMKIPSNNNWIDGSLFNTNTLSNSYFALRMEFSMNNNGTSTYYPRDFIPNFVNGQNGAYQITGKIRLELQPKYFTSGDENCYLSWGLTGFTTSNKTNNIQTVNQTKLLNTLSDNTLDAKIGENNIFIPNQWIDSYNYVPKSKFDINYPICSSSQVSLQSKSTVNLDGTSNFIFLADGNKNLGTNNVQYFTFGLFSSCFRYNSQIPQFTSLFNYFEVRLQLSCLTNSITNTYTVCRSIRFFKYVTDLGIINKSNYKYSSTGVTFHTTNFLNTVQSKLVFPSLYNNGVCLLQINYNDIISFQGNSNTLIIYLNNLMLLDIDYSDLTSTYPMFPKVNAYAMNSNPFSSGVYINPLGNFSPLNINYYNLFLLNWNSSGPRTIAYNFLGPILQIDFSSFVSPSLNSDLLIPTFCPLTSGGSNSIASNPFYSPVVTVVWNTSKSKNYLIDSIDTIIAPPNSVAPPNNSIGYFMPPFESIIRSLPSDAPVIYASLRFNAYSQNDNNRLYIIGNANTQSTQSIFSTNNYRCSGFVFLLSNFLTISNNLNLNTIVNILPNSIPPNNPVGTPSTNGGYSSLNSTAPFYFLGKPYNGIAAFGLNQPINMFVPNSINYLNGISRPKLESFINNSTGIPYLDTINKIGFYCTSSGTSVNDTSYYTNLSNNVLPVSQTMDQIGNFILDWFPDNSTLWSNLTIGPEINSSSQNVFLNDWGGNLRLTMNLPNGTYLVTGVSGIRIKSTNLFNINTICSINDNVSVYANKCYLSSSNSLDCIVSSFSSNFSICCYNVLTNSNQIPFPNVSMFYLSSNPFYTGLNTTVISEVATITNTNGIVYNTGNNNSLDIVNVAGFNNSAIVQSISYIYYQQINAIDKALFTIVLPRRAVPYSFLRITEINDRLSNFFLSQNFLPKCKVTFSPPNNTNSYDDRDYLLNSCRINKNEIYIEFRGIIRKCGIQMPKYLYLYLLPINAISFIETLNNMMFSIDWKLKGTLNDLAKNGQPYPAIYLGPPMNPSQISNLTNNSKILTLNDSYIVPKIVNEFADYTFYINFTNFTNFRDLVNFNEIFFYFNSDNYYIAKSVITNQIMCSYGQFQNFMVNTPCFLLETNVIKISFTNEITYNQSLFINLSGIQNPLSINDLYFLFSLNYFNRFYNKRTFIVNGYAIYKNGISDPNSQFNIGPLFIVDNSFRITNALSYTTKKNPLYLLVAFDSTLNPAIIPQIINSATIAISFPYPDFPFLNLQNLNITANVYVRNTNQGIIEFKSIPSGIPIRKGNKIFLNIGTVTITPNFINFEIYIIGFPTPSIPYDMTSRLKILIFDNGYNSIYRCYSNNYVVSTYNMSNPIDDFLLYYRGFQFSLPQNNLLIVVDLCGGVNQINIYAGNIVQCFIRLSIIPSGMTNYFTSITIIDKYNLFFIENNIINFQSVLLNVPFRIGADCLSLPGLYYVNFQLSNTVNFLGMPPILINVQNKQFSFNISSIPDVYDSGNQIFQIIISDFTSKTLIFPIYGAEGNSNDPNVNVSNVTIEEFEQIGLGAIDIQSSGVKGIQYFTVFTPNSCFGSTSTTFSFNVVNATFPNFTFISNDKIINAFSGFINGDGNVIKKNQYQFSFTPPFAPINFYCVFLIKSMDIPSNDDIVTGNINQSPLKYWIYNQFFNTTTKNILLDNLIRDSSYKLKCILQSTESIMTMRKNRTIQLDYIPGSNNTEIMTSVNSPIYSIIYKFNGTPTQDLLVFLLNFCQSNFIINTTIDSTNPASIFCIDSNGNPINGLNLTNSQTLNLGSGPTVHWRRNLQTVLGNNLGGTNPLPNIYQIFIVQDKLSPSNSINGTDVIQKMNAFVKQNFSQSISNQNYLKMILNTSYFVDTKPNTNLTYSDYKFNQNGFFYINISNFNNSLFCYWSIKLKEILSPTFDSIKNCADINWCGNITITPNGSYINSSETNSKPFSNDYNYSLCLACYNLLPYDGIKGNPSCIFNFTLKINNLTIPYLNTSLIPQAIPYLNFSELSLVDNVSEGKFTSLRINACLIIYIIYLVFLI